jgi:hypothetical protein
VVGPVEIPRKLYLFAKNVQDRKNAATVEVARYALGYWHSEDFEVKPGETIGKEMEPKTDEKDKRLTQMQMLNPRITGGDPAMSPYSPYMTPGMGMGPGAAYGAAGPDDVTLPKTIDYRTGKVLVDLVQVNDWGQAPNLRPRMYHEMLYTDDGVNIEHMPVETKNWPKYLADAYRVVKDDLRKEKQPLRDFKKGGMRGRVQPGMMGGYEDMGMYDESMMYMTPGAGPYR